MCSVCNVVWEHCRSNTKFRAQNNIGNRGRGLAKFAAGLHIGEIAAKELFTSVPTVLFKNVVWRMAKAITFVSSDWPFTV